MCPLAHGLPNRGVQVCPRSEAALHHLHVPVTRRHATREKYVASFHSTDRTSRHLGQKRAATHNTESRPGLKRCLRDCLRFPGIPTILTMPTVLTILNLAGEAGSRSLLILSDQNPVARPRRQGRHMQMFLPRPQKRFRGIPRDSFFVTLASPPRDQLNCTMIKEPRHVNIYCSAYTAARLCTRVFPPTEKKNGCSLGTN
jgi:hypothetical protein